VELLFPRTLSEDMKDVFILPIGLGLRGVGRSGSPDLSMYLCYPILGVPSSPHLRRDESRT